MLQKASSILSLGNLDTFPTLYLESTISLRNSSSFQLKMVFQEHNLGTHRYWSFWIQQGDIAHVPTDYFSFKFRIIRLLLNCLSLAY